MSRKKKIKIEGVENREQWPEWDKPSDIECFELAKIIAKYVKFLAPEIIGRIVEDNEKNRAFYRVFLDKAGINPDLYLWDKCSCCFPGIRRHSGRQEINVFKDKKSSKKKEKFKIDDAIALDDNSYPKQIWSFIFTGDCFRNIGPKGYCLAHLIDHKKNNNRMKDEFEFAENRQFEKPFYGLFTCATNTIYIPNNLMKPTDFNKKIRAWLIKKAYSLYGGGLCNLVPSFVHFKDTLDSEWDSIDFGENIVVGNMTNVEAFLKYREKAICDILKTKN